MNSNTNVLFSCHLALITHDANMSVNSSLTVNSGHDRGECCLPAVFFALLTCWHVQFSKTFAFLFSPKINLYVYAKLVLRGNPEFTKQWRSSLDNFALLCRLTLLLAGKKSTTVNHFTINHALQIPWSLFVPLESSTLLYSCIFKKFLLWNFSKIFSLRQRFCCYIHRLEQWIFNNYSLKSRWIKIDLLKIDLCRIFNHGNSWVYHFANNSVMA